MFDIRDKQLVCLFASENLHPKPNRKYTPRNIRGMTVSDDIILYGDDGSNVKVIDWKKGIKYILLAEVYDKLPVLYLLSVICLFW